MTGTSTLQVMEIFRSIQGESTRVGIPCTFVRLAGCNLRCRWCDTTYAYEGGTPMTVEEVVGKVRALVSPLVEVTGGEPLLQRATVGLLEALLELRAQSASPVEEVMLETNGSLDISAVPAGVLRIVDVKCPASGMREQMLMSNLDELCARDEVKFVIADRSDYEWARDFVRKERRLDQAGAVHFMPVTTVLQPRDLAEWILADGLRVRFSLQLHKVIWGPETRR